MMKKMYQLGVIVGKFYPFHLGHKYLIETGMQQSEQLIVMVTALRNKELIPAETRAAWISETFPELDVRVIEDIGYDDDSKKWAEYTISLIGKAPDVVFTSEQYGITWAQELGCAHVQVDQPRTTYPVSGTLVRSDPVAYWDMLPPATKRFFAQRIVLIGAESTGKSTLARMLAEHYQTNLVHEYGRYYTELRRHNSSSKSSQETGIQLEWQERDFVNIATTQNLIEDQLAESTNRLLICDTDAFATHIWHYRYTKKWSKVVAKIAEQSKPLLYIVTPPDIPFEQDGTRDGQHIREHMHDWVVKALHEANKPFYVVEGGTNQLKRLESAINAIDIAQKAWVKNQAWKTIN